MPRQQRRALIATLLVACGVVAMCFWFGGGRWRLGVTGALPPRLQTVPSTPTVTADGTAPATSAAGNTAPLTPVRVSRGVDGDTIHVVMPDGTDEKVRFIGVDTPESTVRHDPFGKEASDYTRRRLPVGTRIWLETDVGARDRYGRLLAYIWLAPPTGRGATEIRAKMFNAQLLEEGYAVLMTVPPNVRYVELFRVLQREARSANRGLWRLRTRSST